jgi:hypothetical protein
MVGRVDPLRSVVVAAVPLTAVVAVIEPAAKRVVAVVVWLERVDEELWRTSEAVVVDSTWVGSGPEKVVLDVKLALVVAAPFGRNVKLKSSLLV